MIGDSVIVPSERTAAGTTLTRVRLDPARGGGGGGGRLELSISARKPPTGWGGVFFAMSFDTGRERGRGVAMGSD